MGMGTNIKIITEPPAPPWPTEEVTVVCSGCGATLGLTRYVDTPPPIILAIYSHLGLGKPSETEQYCPICGTAAG